MNSSNFHISLRQLREARGLSQEALADDLGVSRQSVQSWESGRMEPKLCAAVKLARYFNTSVEDLMIVKEKGLKKPMLKLDPSADIGPQHVNFLNRFDHENENLPVK